MTYPIYTNLAWLNELPHDKAEEAFLDCCGSSEWARRMAEKRPYKMLENLFTAAEDVWFSLTLADWLEAFASHPRIGSKGKAAAQNERAAQWSGREQSAVKEASIDVQQQLDVVNRLYADKFGFIFIVCATGKTADEILAIARARLGNSLETEIHLAAEEQRKITEIRLKKLLEK